MPPNRVLKKDTITPMLVDYSKKIDVAVNNKAHRKRFKEVLVAFDHHDELYTETDLRLRRITWSHGVKKWLGHDDPEINTTPIDFISEYVHPLVRDWYKAFENAATLTFTQKQYTYLKSRYTIMVPVRNANGQYVLIKQMSMPFGFDKDGQLVSFINSFTLFGTYRGGEPLKLEVYEGPDRVNDGTYDHIENLIYPCIRLHKKDNLTQSFFSIIDIIRELKENGEAVNSRNISKHFKGLKRTEIKRESATTYLNRIRLRLTSLFLENLPREEKKKIIKEQLPNFKDPLQLIDYFEQSGILNLLRKYYQNK